VDGRTQLGGALHQRLGVTASPGFRVKTASGDSVGRFIHYGQVSGLYNRICGGAVDWAGRSRFPIPDGVIEILHWLNPSGRTVALASNKMEGEGGRCVDLTTLPPSCANFLEILEAEPRGALRACSEDSLNLWFGIRDQLGSGRYSV
jgi:hypothetical protein